MGVTSVLCTDHPRSRGVYDEGGWPAPGLWGSSPLARGLLPGAGGVPRRPGIIPARAGFTCGGGDRARRRRDHPRSRGVYLSSKLAILDEDGSSPLARGLPPTWEWGVDGRGIIPARAGFTGSCLRQAPGLTDHPRSRGVYFATNLRAEALPGSSPLARGLRLGQFVPVVRRRIIPARAGFTRRIVWSARAATDHPRSRRVYTSVVDGR